MPSHLLCLRRCLFCLNGCHLVTEYVRQLPFGLLSMALGHGSTYSWDLGTVGEGREKVKGFGKLRGVVP